MFEPDEPLMNEALRDFYVRRDDNLVDAGFITLCEKTIRTLRHNDGR